jgi:hypothetical protein
VIQPLRPKADWTPFCRRWNVPGLKHVRYDEKPYPSQAALLHRLRPPVELKKSLREGHGEALGRFISHHLLPWLWEELLHLLRPPPPYAAGLERTFLFEIDLIERFEQFIKQYGEGALVVLVLLMTLDEPYQWRRWQFNYDGKNADCLQRPYNMLYLPPLKNHDPLAVFLTLNQLAELLPRLEIANDGRKYLWWCPQSFNEYRLKGAPRERFHQPPSVSFYNSENWQREIARWEKREDIAFLSQLMAQHPRWREPEWLNGEKHVKTYLMARACDSVKYGWAIADQTFPQPTLPGVSSVEMGVMVILLVQLLQEHAAQKEAQREQCASKERATQIKKAFDQTFHHPHLPVSAYLPSRVLSKQKREAVKRACLSELAQGGDASSVLKVIDEFVQFCQRLSQPENHIKKPSGQYLETEVNSRTFADMALEMSWELATQLPRYTAYAKLIQAHHGEQRVSGHKLKTLPLPPPTHGQENARLLARNNTLSEGLIKARDAIEEEIRQRQEALQSRVHRSPRKKPAAKTPPPSDDPPPMYE